MARPGRKTCRVFVESFAPAPQMHVFGAVDFTGALVRVAKVLGYKVTVCDAREVFATRQRFPQADHVVVDWPHRLLDTVGEHLGPRDAICVLTHDAKFDVPALMSALWARGRATSGPWAPAARIRTGWRGCGRQGLSDADLERIHAPVGLDLGARTPEETAISICAEIIADRTGRGAGRLASGSGPIH